jgi:hypothetical protein
MMAALVVVVAAALAAESTLADPLSESLKSLSFLNSGTVRATDEFSRLTQCNGFTECCEQMAQPLSVSPTSET